MRYIWQTNCWAFSLLNFEHPRKQRHRQRKPKTLLQLRFGCFGCFFGRFGGARRILIHTTSINIWGQRRIEGSWLPKFHCGCKRGHSAGRRGRHPAGRKTACQGPTLKRPAAKSRSSQVIPCQESQRGWWQRSQNWQTGAAQSSPHEDFGAAAGTLDGVLHVCGVGIVHSWPRAVHGVSSLVGFHPVRDWALWIWWYEIHAFA